nr:BICD family-like cargo adapter 2 [Lytechinus pictus]
MVQVPRYYRSTIAVQVYRYSGTTAVVPQYRGSREGAEQLQQQKAQLETDLAQLSQENLDLQEELENYHMEIDEVGQEMRDQREEKKLMERRIADIEAFGKNEVQRLQEKLSLDVRAVQEENASVVEEKEALQTQLEDALSDNSILKEDGETMKEENERLQEASEAVAKQRDGLKEELVVLSSRILGLEQQLMEQGTVDERLQKLQSSEQKMREISAVLEERGGGQGIKRDRCETLTQRIAGLVEQNKSLKGHLRNMERNVKDMERQITNLDDEKTALIRQVEEREISISRTMVEEPPMVVEEAMVQRSAPVQEQMALPPDPLTSGHGVMEEEVTMLKQKLENMEQERAMLAKECAQTEVASLQYEREQRVFAEDALRNTQDRLREQKRTAHHHPSSSSSSTRKEYSLYIDSDDEETQLMVKAYKAGHHLTRHGNTVANKLRRCFKGQGSFTRAVRSGIQPRSLMTVYAAAIHIFLFYLLAFHC